MPVTFMSEDRNKELNNHWYNNPTAWGWILTGAIGTLIVLYWWNYPEAFKLLLDDANEVGDFLAGTAGTLALVWLIVGYFLQREELRQNTDALQDQKKEFEKQVVELNKQVSATNKMADAMLRMAKSNESLVKFYESQSIKDERERVESAKPVFESGGGTNGTLGIQFKVVNRGKHVHDLKLSVVNEGVSYNPEVIKKFGDQESLSLLCGKKFDYNWPLKFSIKYKDIYGNLFEEIFEFESNRKLNSVDKHQITQESNS